MHVFHGASMNPYKEMRTCNDQEPLMMLPRCAIVGTHALRWGIANHRQSLAVQPGTMQQVQLSVLCGEAPLYVCEHVIPPSALNGWC